MNKKILSDGPVQKKHLEAKAKLAQLKGDIFMLAGDYLSVSQHNEIAEAKNIDDLAERVVTLMVKLKAETKELINVEIPQVLGECLKLIYGEGSKVSVVMLPDEERSIKMEGKPLKLSINSEEYVDFEQSIKIKVIRNNEISIHSLPLPEINPQINNAIDDTEPPEPMSIHQFNALLDSVIAKEPPVCYVPLDPKSEFAINGKKLGADPKVSSVVTVTRPEFFELYNEKLPGIPIKVSVGFDGLDSQVYSDSIVVENIVIPKRCLYGATVTLEAEIPSKNGTFKPYKRRMELSAFSAKDLKIECEPGGANRVRFLSLKK